MSEGDRAQAEARFRIMGEIVWLLGQTPRYDDAGLRDVAALFFRPLALQQLRIWRRGHRPVAVATWGWLSDEAARRHVETGEPLGRDDWRSGEALWFIDMVAPFGDGRAVARELLWLIPPGAVGQGVRRTVDGELRRVARYRSIRTH